MFTAYNITSLFKSSSWLIMSTLFIFNQSAQANLPMSNDGGVPKLGGVQIGMTADQAKQALTANGYTPQPSAPNMILHYAHDQDTITFRPGKHDPVAMMSYQRLIKFKSKDLATINGVSKDLINQFMSTFGQQAKCVDRNYGRADCEYKVNQGNKTQYQINMQLNAGRLMLYLSGDPKLAKNLAGTTTSKASKPRQQKTSKRSRFTVTLKNNVVYINNLRLGMPDNAAKEEIKKLKYKMNNEMSGQFNAYNDKDSVRAKLRRGKLRSISTNEHYLQIDVENYINKLKASFGDKITCIINSGRSSCNYVRREQGKLTSLTLSFIQGRNDKKNNILRILLK